MNHLYGKIRAECVLNGTISMPIGYKDYDGSYLVTPKTVEQSLSTTDKHMTQDVVIAEIPYYEVSNQQNGTTIIIGGN